ncbi:hypothetical protein GPJ56_007426 [Histomonas meleagridis]|uniref:uncharacterized protein n=1 Tax=Histomonas meleagridis TaxID=135588 RepID=UPI0035598422|nr:hypothetical protein GPJ56_007426 [Histomonas meleagridis]KAH0804272.1 hypothetical protein GO595_003102 [Histomonas meleagridis]
MLSSRKASNFEKFLFNLQCDTEIAIQLEHPKFVAEYLQRFIDNSFGLKLAYDGENMIARKHPYEPVKLPNTNSLADACNAIHSLRAPYSKSIGTIGYNDTHIALNLNHSVGDGLTLVNLMKKIQELDYKPYDLPLLPEPATETFKEQIGTIDISFPYYNRDTLTQTKSKTGLKDLPETSEYHFTVNTKEIQPYDSTTQKCHGFTEYLWNGLTLSMCALNNQIGPIGVATCVDIRHLIPKSGPQHCNHFSNVFVSSPVSRSITVGELGVRMRSDFNNRLKRGDVFAYLHPDKVMTGTIDGANADLSQLPPIHIRRPITNCYVQTIMVANNSISVLGESIINEDTNTNMFTARSRYSETYVSAIDMKKIMEGMKYFIMNVSNNTTVGDAVEMIRKYQSHIKE